MADNDFMPCPSQTAGGREDRCGQYSNPRTCWFGNCCMYDTKPPYFDAKGNAIPAYPTPSITVGTQVRLTGVVHDIGGKELKGKAQVIIFGSSMPASGSPWVATDALEVIRQPFKRGEVVYLSGWPTIETCPCRVLEDEREGKVLLVGEVEGSSASYVEAGAYERRND